MRERERERESVKSKGIEIKKHRCRVINKKRQTNKISVVSTHLKSLKICSYGQKKKCRDTNHFTFTISISILISKDTDTTQMILTTVHVHTLYGSC